MKTLPILFSVIFLASTCLRGNDVTDDPGHIRIEVNPFYNAVGPTVTLSHYSEGLASKDEKVVLATIAEMRKAWQKLTALQMYVAAIRLYDLGYRKEGVYWFYSAQYRGRLFNGLIDQDKMGGIGDPGFEQFHAAEAFYELSGPYFNGYAFGDPDWLAGVVRRVQKEGLTIPDMNAAYPGVEFKDKSQWEAINKGLNDGMGKLIDVLGDKEKMKQGMEQRKKTGFDAAFSKLTSKDLPAS